jgi:hypothetical protein
MNRDTCPANKCAQRSRVRQCTGTDHAATEPKLIWRVGAGEGFASPVVAGGKVFYFENQDAKETLHAIDATDPHDLWRASVDDTF